MVREDVEYGGNVEWKPSFHAETVLRSSGDGLSVVPCIVVQEVNDLSDMSPQPLDS